MRISIASLSALSALVTCCASSASGGGASTSPSKSLPDHLPIIFDQPTTDLSSTTFSSNGLEITNSYADEEDREWYENQYEAIGSAKELKEALLVCKDFYAIDPKWKSGVIERILGYISESAPDKPQIGQLSSMQMKVAVNCVSLDRTFGAGIKNTEDYHSLQALVASRSTPKDCEEILTLYCNRYMEIFFRGGQYAPDDEDAAAQMVKTAFHNLLKSAYVLNHHREKGRMIDDMTPVQVLLVGRLFKASEEEPTSKKSSKSSEKWKEELKRLGKILTVVVLCFCAAIAHICMNLEEHKAERKERKNSRTRHNMRIPCRNRTVRTPKVGKKLRLWKL